MSSPTNENLPVHDRRATASGEQAVLGYARAAHGGTRPAGLIMKLVWLKLMLTAAAGFVLSGVPHDADPFSTSRRQSFTYAVLAPSVIVGCALWAGWSVVLIVRRRLPLAMALAVSALAVWGGLVSYAMYSITADFIQQTTRFQGASWPVLRKIFHQ